MEDFDQNAVIRAVMGIAAFVDGTPDGSVAKAFGELAQYAHCNGAEARLSDYERSLLLEAARQAMQILTNAASR